MLAPVRLSIILLVICGGLYPALVTLVGGALFPYQAGGSIINDSGGTPVGSELIAQAFDKDVYF
ncbi:MAG TPA: potassium-transporting ATPase subunit C, partial [Ktedonobacterales bacterium]|nr:potassium-transporting ATPase subunit C [Ktedonobacterales bacterium]